MSSRITRRKMGKQARHYAETRASEKRKGSIISQTTKKKNRKRYRSFGSRLEDLPRPQGKTLRYRKHRKEGLVLTGSVQRGTAWHSGAWGLHTLFGSNFKQSRLLKEQDPPLGNLTPFVLSDDPPYVVGRIQHGMDCRVTAERKELFSSGWNRHPDLS